MSDVYQTFVSVDMNWQPKEDAAAKAVEALWSMSPHAEEIKTAFTEQIDYVDPMDNWGGAACPACGKLVTIDWFGDTMIDWYKSETRPMKVVMPCCKTASTLDALQFVTPAAFTRFRLEMYNSPIEISEVQIRQLEDILGTKLLLVWVHV